MRDYGFIRKVFLSSGLSVSLAVCALAAPMPAGPSAQPEPDPKALPASTPGNQVVSVAYSPDGKLLAVVEANLLLGSKNTSRLMVFDSKTYALIRQVDGPANETEAIPALRGVRFFPDGKSLVLTYHGGSLYTCDLATWTIRKPIKDSASILLNLSMSPDGKLLSISHYPRQGGQIRNAIWDSKTFKPLRDIKLDVELPYGGIFSPGGEALAFGYTGREAGVVEIDPLSGKEVRRIALKARTPGAKPVATPVKYTPDSKWLVMGGGEAIPVRANASALRGYLRVWNRETGEVRTQGDGKNDYFRTVTLSPDGKRIYGGTNSDVTNQTNRMSWKAGEVCCWDTDTGREIWSTKLDAGAPEKLVVAPSGLRLWVADAHGLWMLDAETGKSCGQLIQTSRE